jgi:hypothetical protein
MAVAAVSAVSGTNTTNDESSVAQKASVDDVRPTWSLSQSSSMPSSLMGVMSQTIASPLFTSLGHGMSGIEPSSSAPLLTLPSAALDVAAGADADADAATQGFPELASPQAHSSGNNHHMHMSLTPQPSSSSSSSSEAPRAAPLSAPARSQHAHSWSSPQHNTSAVSAAADVDVQSQLLLSQPVGTNLFSNAPTEVVFPESQQTPAQEQPMQSQQQPEQQQPPQQQQQVVDDMIPVSEADVAESKAEEADAEVVVEEPARHLLLVMQVQVSKTVSDQILFYEGDQVEAVVAQFGAVHNLGESIF